MKIHLSYPIAAIGIGCALAFVTIHKPSNHYIWNRTASAPIGLYRVSNNDLKRQDWAVVSADSASSNWIAERGFLHDDWPIIKRIVGISGDEICRHNLKISMNGEHIATATETDSFGQQMPTWSGCFTLKSGEYFLLNEHERSLDGRYFGATARSDIDGGATLFWRN